MTKIILNNSLNSASNNPPGYNIWVGGQEHGDTAHGAVKVNKGQTNVELDITPDVLCNGNLLTWYYDYGWYSGEELHEPFTDGEEVKIPAVDANADEIRNSLFNLEGAEERPRKRAKKCLT